MKKSANTEMVIPFFMDKIKLAKSGEIITNRVHD